MKGHRHRAALLIACALGLALFPGTARHLDPMPWNTAPDLRSYAFHGESMKEEEKEGPSSYPSEWQWLRRTAPLWKADPEAFRETSNRARRMRSEARGNQLFTQAVVEAGPSNIGGRISDIEWNPVAPSIIYAGSATGGVYKTIDTGANWFPIADDLPNLNVGDLAIDPSAPNTVWLGTGEANGGHNNFPGGGVFRSTDGGASWTLMGLENSASVGRILVDPTNSQRVFVAAQGSYFGPNPERGVYRTTDGGATWQKVLFVSDSTAATDIVMDPSNPNRLMAAMWERVRRPNGGTHLYGATSGIWRSVDGGDTWSPMGPAQGLPDAGLQTIGRIGLTLCALDPDVVYTVITNGNYPIGIWRTTDFGDNWINQDIDQEVQSAAFGFSWYFSQIRVAPDDCDRVYVLDGQLLYSSDAALSFSTASSVILHVDHHALAFNPTNSDFIFEGNDGGLVYSTDAGSTWNKVWVLPNIQFYEIGLDPSDPARKLGGAQDNGTLATFTGATDDWVGIFGGDGFYVNVDPRDSDVIYAEYQNGHLYKSINGGGTWMDVTPPLFSFDRTNWSTPVRLDPQNPDIVYYGSQAVWRSPDGGATWTAVSGDLTNWVSGALLGTITTIAPSAVDSNRVWVGTDDGKVWRGDRDGGGVFTWTDVRQANLPDRWVTRVVPHPTDHDAAWVTFNGLKWVDPESHVFYTDDGGASWTDISSNLPDAPINALAVDPLDPNTVFVGTDLGAYHTKDNGAHWFYLSPDLPMVSVYDLAIHPTARYLAIGTHGRSMYTMDLTSQVAADEPRAARATLAQSLPNPVSSGTTISYTLAKEGAVRLEMFDVTGRRVRTLDRGIRPAGRHDVSWDGRDGEGRLVPSGSYRYVLELPGGERLSRGLIVLR